MTLTGLDHVQLAAPPDCEAAARAFFGGVLGLREVEKPAALAGRGGAWFQLGAQQLHVGVDAAFEAARKAHPALTAAAGTIDALARRLADAGHPVAWDEAIPGVRRFYVGDPWGNRLEVIEPVAR